MRRLALAIALLAWAPPALAQDDEIIDDPLLAKPAGAVGKPPPPRGAPPPTRPKIWSATLVTRAATQTSWDDLPGGAKDVVELRTRILLNAGEKVSERLIWQLGVRFDALAHAPKSHTKLIDEPAWQFEARPWEAYVDIALARRLRLKLGNQIVNWGRLDVGSAADMLGAYDLREGAGVDIDALRIPTPTATLTWFPWDGFQLDVGYTPFFTPHRFDVLGTNFSMVGPNTPAMFTATFAKLRGQLDPSSYVLLTQDLARANAPSARPDNGEAAARAVWHAGPYDLGVSYGFLRSKLPAFAISPALVELLAAPSLTSAGRVNAAIEAGEHLIDASYDRYHQVAFDLEGAVGSVTLAGEVGFSPSRTLFIRDRDNGFPTAQSTGLLQTGLKATYAKEETFAVSAEASLFTATDGDAAGRPYYVLGSRRRLGVASLFAHKEVGAHLFDASLQVTSSGPSFSVVPRYGYRVAEPLVLGAGAAFFGGPRGDDGSLAALQKGLDHVFVYADLRL